MKKLFYMLVILFSLYFMVQVAFRFLGKGYSVNYQITTDSYIADIKEVFTANTKNETDNYFFEIKMDNNTFYIQTYLDFTKKDTIIKSLKYIKINNYRCLLPVFVDKGMIIDIMCLKDNMINYYHDLVGKDIALDNEVSKIENYHVTDWQDETINTAIGYLGLYKSNVKQNHQIGLVSYSGVYVISSTTIKTIENIELFDKDTYTRNLSAFVKGYYVSADYSDDYEFNTFFITKIKTGKKEKIKYTSYISNQSYIQGVVDDSLYIYDPASKKQYEIDVEELSMIEVGNTTIGVKFYESGVWSQIATSKLTNGTKKFTYTPDYLNSNYDETVKVGNESGYYYFYKKVGNIYKVYRSTVRSKEQLTYLFETTRIDNICFVDDYVYYINNDTILYYHDTTGNRKLISYSELEFNRTIIFGAYAQ